MSSNHTIAEILRKGLPAYKMQHGKLSPQQWKVVNNIMNCHTPALGSETYQCDTCGNTVVHYHSCRDRHCPSCQGTARAQWVEDRMNELLPTGYFHVVFTIPHELNKFALYNRKKFYDLFYRAVSDTLLKLAKDRKWLGGVIGVIAVLHTWGQNLMDHPHIHCIIPGGGIRNDGKKWLTFRKDYFLPVNVMRILFRRLFLEYFKEATQEPSFVIPPEWDDGENKILSLFAKLRTKQWVVYAKKPFANAGCVVKYLGNYTHRIAISNQRIVKSDEENVWFKWKDYRNGNQQKTMRISIPEFIRRYTLHVLPKGFVRVRYFGFLSNKDRKKKISECFALFGKKYQIRNNSSDNSFKRIHICINCRKGKYAEKLKAIRAKYKTQWRNKGVKRLCGRPAAAWPAVVQHRLEAAPGLKAGFGPAGT